MLSLLIHAPVVARFIPGEKTTCQFGHNLNPHTFGNHEVLILAVEPEQDSFNHQAYFVQSTSNPRLVAKAHDVLNTSQAMVNDGQLYMVAERILNEDMTLERARQELGF